MGVLTRPVDVRVAERHEGKLVLGLVEERVELAGALADAVGAERVRRMRLGRGEGLLLAVDRTARGDEHDATDTRLARGLEEVDRAEDVDAGVEERVRHRAADVHLCGVVVQHVGSLVAEELGRPWVLDVEGMEARPWIQVLPVPGGEIVHHDHVVPGREVGIHHVRPDEPRPAGHEDLHRPGASFGRK